MVRFEKCSTVAKLQSLHCKGYYVIGHYNMLRSAGWHLCHFGKNGGRPLSKALYCFKTLQSRTPRLEKHIPSHKNRTGLFRFQRPLPGATLTKVARAISLAAFLDVLPLSFCDAYTGERHFAQIIFETVQTIIVNKKRLQSYLPDRTAVRSTSKKFSRLRSPKVQGRL